MKKAAQLKSMWPAIQQKLQNPPQEINLGGFKMPQVDKIIFDDMPLAEEPNAIAYVSTEDADNNGMLDSMHIIVPRMEQALRERGISGPQDLDDMQKLYSLLTAFVEVFAHEMAHMPAGGKIPDTGDPLRPESHAHSEGEAAARRVQYTPMPLAATNIQNKFEKLGSSKMKDIIKVLKGLGDSLDARGATKLANDVDNILRKAQEGKGFDWEPSLQRFRKDTKDPSAQINHVAQIQQTLVDLGYPIGSRYRDESGKEKPDYRWGPTSKSSFDKALKASGYYDRWAQAKAGGPGTRLSQVIAILKGGGAKQESEKTQQLFEQSLREMDEDPTMPDYTKTSNEIITSLKSLADSLDARGEIKFADQVDNILKRVVAQEGSQQAVAKRIYDDILAGQYGDPSAVGAIQYKVPNNLILARDYVGAMEELSRRLGPDAPPGLASRIQGLASVPEGVTPLPGGGLVKAEAVPPLPASPGGTPAIVSQPEGPSKGLRDFWRRRDQAASWNKAFKKELGMSPGPKDENVRAVQRALAEIGYDIGARAPEELSDGLWGPASQYSWKRFLDDVERAMTARGTPEATRGKLYDRLYSGNPSVVIPSMRITGKMYKLKDWAVGGARPEGGGAGIFSQELPSGLLGEDELKQRVTERSPLLQGLTSPEGRGAISSVPEAAPADDGSLADGPDESRIKTVDPAGLKPQLQESMPTGSTVPKPDVPDWGILPALEKDELGIFSLPGEKKPAKRTVPPEMMDADWGILPALEKDEHGIFSLPEEKKPASPADDLATATAKKIEESLKKQASNLEHIFSLPSDGGPFGRN